MTGRPRAAGGSLAIRYGYAPCSLALILIFPFLGEAGRLGVVRLAAFASLAAAVAGAGANTVGVRHQKWVALLVAGLVSINVSYIVVLVPVEWAFILSELLNALGSVVLFAAAVSAARSIAPADIGGVVDTAIIGLAVGGLLWNFALLPPAQAVHTPLVSQIKALLVVFALAGVLGAVARLRRASEGRLAPLWLLGAALVFTLAAQIADAFAGDSRDYPPSAMLRMAAFTCVGVFGLDPATYRLSRPGRVVSERLSRARVWFLGIAVAVIPIALGASEIVGGRINGALLVVGSGLVTALVMFRIRLLSAERSRAEQALDYLASHDELTGLVNRREFMAQLNAAPRDLRSIVLFCDLDRFKEINDRLGHSAGDQVLVEVANRLTASVRETDTVARLGGDEFMLLLRDVQPGDVDEVLARVTEALSPPASLNGELVALSASIGVVSAQEGEADDVIQRADHEMYRAKESRPRQGPVRIVSELDS